MKYKEGLYLIDANKLIKEIVDDIGWMFAKWYECVHDRITVSDWQSFQKKWIKRLK